MELGCFFFSPGQVSALCVIQHLLGGLVLSRDLVEPERVHPQKKESSSRAVRIGNLKMQKPADSFL